MPEIVHLSSVHYTFDTRIFHKQLRAVVERGWTARFITHHPRTETVDGVQIISAGEFGSRPQRWSHLPRFYWLARAQSADVYQIHDPELLPVAVALARQTDGRVLYDVHEEYTDAIAVREWIPEILKPLLIRAFPRIQATAMTQLDGVITADEPTAERIRQRGIEPVTAIHNYPKTKAIAIADLDIERSHDYVFVYVGNLTPERGLFRMIDFVAALRDAGMDAGLWLLGTIDNNALERDVQSRIASEGIEDAVQLFGWVPYEDIFSYLVLADAGLLLLDADRFTHNVPTKLFEYMSIGLPIVATPTNSVQQYLPADRAVFVADGDVNAPPMGEIRAFLDGWDEKASAELKRLVEEQYSWETEVIELLSFYESLLYM